ncbi:MAG: hypothetical protein ACI8X5_002856 [Planctomycetota bacterium]|jgi:hypothetical protein
MRFRPCPIAKRLVLYPPLEQRNGKTRNKPLEAVAKACVIDS